tara:strand:- start:28668 stop:29351 length:684 start_codon:yes stop_codon:yes gene_type:complete
MGQKVNPNAIRLGIIKEAKSKWFEKRKKVFSQYVYNDYLIRKWIKKELYSAGVGDILIERQTDKVGVIIKASRPGIIIGKKGEDIDKLRRGLSQLSGVPTHVSIQEIKKPELHAQLVAETIAQQLEKRVMFRRAMKRAVSTAMRMGAKGIKVCVAGRLGGAEIARSEWYREGRVPLHTFRADIDYGVAEANTTYGIIGVKIWIFKGEVIKGKSNKIASKNEQESNKK